ncbi:MAG: winged helix-turn-helix transcriptional regulator [Bacteroidales bacterium]|nr:winged helix-turn-helix transcriptional regulator [Bacteroidales bacterium]
MRIISENPNIRMAEISKELGISIKAVEKHIRNLKKEGLLIRVGPDNGGHWEIVSPENK